MVPIAEVVDKTDEVAGVLDASMIANDVVILAGATAAAIKANHSASSISSASSSSSPLSSQECGGEKTAGEYTVPYPPAGSPPFGLDGDDDIIDTKDDEEDLFVCVTDAKASTYSFVERLSHYMERHIICDGNRKAVELAIMIEAGSMVREWHQMKSTSVIGILYVCT